MSESSFIKFENRINIIQKVITITAIIIGGIWTLNKFVIHRESVSKANISHKIAERKLSDEYVLLAVYIKVENVGKTVINLRRGHIRIEDISFPNSYIEKKILNCIEPCSRNSAYYSWNIIQDVSLKWVKGQRIIEPSSIDNFFCEFIIRSKYNVVKVYSYFSDEEKKYIKMNNKGTINDIKTIGWEASTLYNLQSN